MKYMVKISYLATFILLVVSSASASLYGPTCNFNGSVHLNGSDLPSYASDQIGCGLQRVSNSWGILIISVFALGILIFMYGLYKKK